MESANVAESGAEAGAIIAEGDVLVDGEVETRRGRQVEPGSVVEVRLPGTTLQLKVESALPAPGLPDA